LLENALADALRKQRCGLMLVDRVVLGRELVLPSEARCRAQYCAVLDAKHAKIGVGRRVQGAGARASERHTPEAPAGGG
jgi:hypothetical protein